jgi:hypothetical protein
MEDENPEEVAARIRRAQLLTCPCCLLKWATVGQARLHLSIMIERIKAKDRELSRS